MEKPADGETEDARKRGDNWERQILEKMGNNETRSNR